MAKLVAIDSMAILYRSYFAMIRNPLINSKGINTSGLFGFLAQIIKIVETETLDYLAVATDLPDPTFRHQQFTAYKATREKMPDDLVAQLPFLSRLIEALDLPYLSLSGYEADDIIGTLMRLCLEKNIEGVMVTGDKDYMQLITDRIVMLNQKNEIVDVGKVFKRFGCTPEQVIEVLGLMGDTSDNIPGVKGVGEKTAVKLIQRYGSIDKLYENLDEVRGNKLKENLIYGKKDAFMSRKLVTIDRHVPLEIDFDSLSFNHSILHESSAFHAILEELEFKSFLKRFAPEEGQAANFGRPPQVISLETGASGQPIAAARHVRVDKLPALEKMVTELEKAQTLAFDMMTSGKNAIQDKILSMAFYTNAGIAYYLPLSAGAFQSDLSVVDEDVKQQMILTSLKPLFENSTLLLVGHDLKLAIQFLVQRDIRVHDNIFDTMIAAHLVEAKRDYNLENLAVEKLKQPRRFARDGSAQTRQLTMEIVESQEVKDEQTQDFLCENTEIIFKLQALLQEQLIKTEMILPFQKIEIPLVFVLAWMELTGVRFDQNHVVEISEDYSKKLEGLSEEIYRLAKERFNINSVVELQSVLYEKLALHKACNIRPKKIKLGNGMSTGEETLEKMSKFSLPWSILQYRTLNKLKNTYIDQLPSFVNPSSLRIHSNFRQAVAATGRLASDNPNLQNIPIRSLEGRRIRKLFIPSSPDHVLISADYSQIELRVVAHYSKDPTFLEAYRKNLDIHALTASAIYNVPVQEVNRESRSKAKEVNFGLIYRMGADRLAIVTQTSKIEARKFIEKYFQKYATIHALQEIFLERARKEGYASTLMGRRRYLPDINGTGLVKHNAEGAAINTPIQGSAAEIIKMAMININRRLQAQQLQSKMILSVHDELVFDALREEKEVLCRLIKEEMENVLILEVPLIAEIGTGSNWLEAH